MTISLYILGWLLSGFLAAWLCYLDTPYRGMSRLAVLMHTLGGSVVLALLLTCLAWEWVLNKDKPFFKAKERK